MAANRDELSSMKEKLLDERMNREIRGQAFEFFDCLVFCYRRSLLKVDRLNASEQVKQELKNLDKLKDVVEMKKTVLSVLEDQKECLKPFLHLLVDDLQLEQTPNDNIVDTIYDTIIERCHYGKVNPSIVKLCLYAAATCIKTNIYVIDENLRWKVFQPLLSNELALDYITMYNTGDKFYEIHSPAGCDSPSAFGLLGEFMDQLACDEELRGQRESALRDLDYAILHKNESVRGFIKKCRLIRKNLDDRRRIITSVAIGSSGVGIASGAMVVAGFFLAPFSGGLSLGLGIAGGLIGIGSGAVSGVASAFEAVKQTMKLKEIETLQATVNEKEEGVSTALIRVIQLFVDGNMTRSLNGKDIKMKKCGARTIVSGLRSGGGVANFALTVAKVGGNIGRAATYTLAPLSIVLDIGVIAQAINTKLEGDRTEAGIILEKTARSAEIKHVLFNSIMRGDCDRSKLLFTVYHD